MDYWLEGQADCCNRLMDPLGRLSFQEPFFKINFMLALLSLRRKGTRPIFFPFFHFRWVLDASFVNINHNGWG